MINCPRTITSLVFSLALIVWSSQSGYGESAGENKEPVTAKITLGPRQGASHPSTHGLASTVGGAIDVSQPSPDTLVVRMTGSTAAVGNCLANSHAAFDFLEHLQFRVEFSRPGYVGKLTLDARADGLLVSQGKHASAAVVGATTAIHAGPEEIASLSLPERIVGGCESVAVSVSQGPICVAIPAGCYALHQQFRIHASHAKGIVTGGKATAEFSPSTLPNPWIGISPFGDVNRSALGYTVTLQVLPETVELASHEQPLDETITLPPLLHARRIRK